MANVVVTGGAGFLGSRLVRELLAAGSIAVDGGAARQLTRVTVLDRRRCRQTWPPTNESRSPSVTSVSCWTLRAAGRTRWPRRM